jgi:hypothetical protein
LQAVLNSCWGGGLSFGFSRFTHDFSDLDLAATLRAWQREISPAGAIFAEITGGAERTNLSMHARLTDYQLVCPGEIATVDAESQIPLEDLTIGHEIESDRLVLRSKRLGLEVIPVYFGYLVPVALPEISRVLLLLSPSAMVTLDPWLGVPNPTQPRGVRSRPRVRHGDLVIGRRHWEVPVDDLPTVSTDMAPGEMFVRWRDWQRRHGIDSQVFFTQRREADDDDAGDERDGPHPREKPHYLDLESCLSMQAFGYALGNDATAVTFTEMLPSGSELNTASGRGSHVAEVAVELFSCPVTDLEARQEQL